MDIDSNRVRRRMPVGAELQTGGVHFRVSAPRSTMVEVVLAEGLTLADAVAAPGKTLARETGGYFSGLVAEARAGNRYGFRLDGGARLLPDPASRFQPDGPHGLSQVVDPGAYAWGDKAWRGVTLRGQVIYELHVGTFTEDGTWPAATAELPRLADLGVTLLEVMPVADFPGQFGWGYDGVNLFAPTRLYGTPDEFRTFVDRAHALGLGVLLDVVYNHFGPDGNYLSQFAADYFTDRFHTDWGEAINFDGPQAGPVREFFIANAGYWVDEFHLDGLRIDAVQAIYDASAEHILAAIGRQVRRGRGAWRAGRGRKRIAGRAPDASHRPRWRGAGRGLERRFSSRGPGGPHRARGPLLRRLSGHAARTRLGRQVGIPLPRAVEHSAAETARLAGFGRRGAPLHHVFAES